MSFFQLHWRALENSFSFILLADKQTDKQSMRGKDNQRKAKTDRTKTDQAAFVATTFQASYIR